MEKFKNESMVDVAYDVLVEKNRIMNFQELYKEVCTKMEFDTDTALNKISSFYTNLTLDGRFVNLGDNLWDLRINQKYEKVHIDINDVYTDMEQESNANVDLDELDDEEKAAAGLDDENGEGDDEFDSNSEDM